jgi:hypothetical protein
MSYGEKKIRINFIVTDVPDVHEDPVTPVKLTWWQRFTKWLDKIFGL